MNYAVAYSDLDSPADFDPTPEEIAPVAKSILAHLRANPNAWHEALSERMTLGLPAELGEAMRDGDLPEIGRLARNAAIEQMSEDANDMAEGWLVDDLTSRDKQRLAEWRPVKYAALGRKYFLAEMLG